jgi:hypothetical protein
MNVIYPGTRLWINLHAIEGSVCLTRNPGSLGIVIFESDIKKWAAIKSRKMHVPSSLFGALTSCTVSTTPFEARRPWKERPTKFRFFMQKAGHALLRRRDEEKGRCVDVRVC